MKKLTITFVLNFLIVSLLSFNVQALPLVFFGEDINVYPGNQVPRIEQFANSVNAQSDFLSHLQGVRVEDFESFTEKSSDPLNVDFGNSGTATLTGGSGIWRITDNTATNSGVFPTSGVNTFVVLSSSGTFSLEFDTAQSAFGFFATDLEEVPAILSFETSYGKITTLNIPYTKPSNSGSVLFFGVIDTENPFTKVTFNGNHSWEGFGFDDFTIGTENQVVNSTPEPSTLLLVGLGLIGLIKFRKKSAL